MPVLPEVGSHQHGLARCRRAFGLHRLYHRKADAVLDAGQGIEKLQLGAELRPDPPVRRKAV